METKNEVAAIHDAKQVVVRDGHDWGQFFFSESSRPAETDGRVIYSATWSCVSSYGVFGHHWSSMGCPFAEFVAQVRKDYLLGKIAEEVFDEKKFVAWLRREVFTSSVTREQKRDAARAIRNICDEYSGEWLAFMAYEDADISRCQPEWSDVDSRSPGPQAVSFVRKLWPKFVAALNATVPAAPAGVALG